MTIIKLEKKKLGDDYKIVRITYKNEFGFLRTKDAIQSSTTFEFWKWADNDFLTHSFDTINEFWNSTALEWELNK